MAQLESAFVVNTDRDRIRGAALGLAAAALFGASAPIAKILLPGSSPFALAGLLYLGAGFGLAAKRLLLRTADGNPEARLRLADAPILGGIVVAGGVIGPVLMLIGLQRLPAITTALLLNLEAPFTMLIAVGLFREHLARREIIGAMLVFLGVVALTYRPGELSGNWIGVAALAGACLSWAVDNNLSQRLSVRDPIAIVRFKALTAGAFSILLALFAGQRIADPLRAGAALLLGSLSYGLSLVLNMRALRILGAARVAAFFATAVPSSGNATETAPEETPQKRVPREKAALHVPGRIHREGSARYQENRLLWQSCTLVQRRLGNEAAEAVGRGSPTRRSARR